ncbi:MAG: hypothetical protein F6K35_33775 [Okeania sp. SIO2H7]|nr:hypothetical protein [Okeania sp. SIO2H7]
MSKSNSKSMSMMVSQLFTDNLLGCIPILRSPPGPSRLLARVPCSLVGHFIEIDRPKGK